MTAKQAAAFRRILVQQRQVLLHEVVHVESDLEAMAAEPKSELEEPAREERTARLLARLDSRGQAELQEIERALARIERHTFGFCEGCRKAIPPGRLAALPATPYCRDCAERVERGEPPLA